MADNISKGNVASIEVNPESELSLEFNNNLLQVIVERLEKVV